MWGGHLTRRERFRTAKTTEIAARIGKKNLFSGRSVIRCCTRSTCELAAGRLRSGKFNNGDTISAKATAKIGTIVHPSIIRPEDLGRPDLKECIEAVDIMVLYWRPHWT
jgi:hypothetical protein